MRSTTFSAERFLPAREILAFAGLSLACRLLTWWAVREIPWLDSPVLDGRAYLDWAREIAGGDALGRGRGVFYQAPLYPYFLAAILKLGGGLEAVRAVQVALGTCATMLVVATTRNLFGARAGVLAGLLFALYPPILIADLQIDKTSVSVFLAALLARLAERALAHGGAARWAGCGAALGGLALVRENALVLLPLLAILGWKSTVDPSFRLRTVAFGLAWLMHLVWNLPTVLAAAPGLGAMLKAVVILGLLLAAVRRHRDTGQLSFVGEAIDYASIRAVSFALSSAVSSL